MGANNHRLLPKIRHVQRNWPEVDEDSLDRDFGTKATTSERFLGVLVKASASSLQYREVVEGTTKARDARKPGSPFKPKDVQSVINSAYSATCAGQSNTLSESGQTLEESTQTAAESTQEPPNDLIDMSDSGEADEYLPPAKSSGPSASRSALVPSTSPNIDNQSSNYQRRLSVGTNRSIHSPRRTSPITPSASTSRQEPTTSIKLHQYMNNLDEDEEQFHKAYLNTANQLKRKRDMYESAKTHRNESLQDYEMEKRKADSAAAVRIRRQAEARDLLQIMDNLPLDKLTESINSLKQIFTLQATELREKANSDEKQVTSIRKREQECLEQFNRYDDEFHELEQQIEEGTNELAHARRRLEEIEDRRTARREERNLLDASL